MNLASGLSTLRVNSFLSYYVIYGEQNSSSISFYVSFLASGALARTSPSLIKTRRKRTLSKECLSEHAGSDLQNEPKAYAEDQMRFQLPNLTSPGYVFEK